MALRMRGAHGANPPAQPGQGGAPRPRHPAPARPRPGASVQQSPPPHVPVPGPVPGPDAHGAAERPPWAQEPYPPAGEAAAHGGPGVPGGAPEGVIPWRPPVADPFLQAAQAQASARPASLGRRFAARLVDNALLAVPAGAVALPLGAKAVDHVDGKIEAAKLSGETVTVWLLDSTTAGYLGVVVGVLLVAGLLLEVLPVVKWGRTLGKRLCGVRVLGMEDYSPPSFGSALRRWLVYGLLGVLGVGVVNVLWCLFDRPWRQCWHDKAARTFVAGSN